jgi:hypothetical protein
MRKLLTLAVIISLLFSVVPFSKTVGKRVALAADQNTTAVNILATVHRVGFGWDNTPLDPPRDFPWQKVGQVCWGRTGYAMPDATKAVSSTGFPTLPTTAANKTIPMYYTQVYLDINAQGGLSQESNPYFVVMDSAGQVWFDPDGFFNDSRYDPTADPIPSRWPFESYPFNNNYSQGSCSTNLKSLMDPATDNNTKGPFFFNKYNTKYQPNQYFWDYKKDELSDNTDRQWRLGWVDMVDYPFAGALSPNGDPITAEVTTNTVTGIGDWDYNLPLVPFYQTDANNISIRYFQEFHSELVPDNKFTPGKMGINGTGERPPEAIYKIQNPIQILDGSLPLQQIVQIGDMRLSAVAKKNLEETKLYPEGTIVSTGDWDLGDVIIPFNFNEKHVDNTSVNKQYDPNEWIYQLPNSSALFVPALNLSLQPGLRAPGAIRLTNVNTKKIEQNKSITLDLGNGMFAGDAIVMMEVMQGGCYTDKYDISVLTDLYMGDYPSSTAAALRTSNGDISVAAQRVQKNTVLDPALDKDRYAPLPGTTFHNVKFEYREFAGLEIFLDNGIDNNIGANHANDLLLAQDLNDNLKEERTGEQYVGAKDYESTLDLGRRLSVIPDFYKFHDVNRPDPIPNGFIPQYGCGEAIYYINDTARTNVLAGDKRFTDVDLVIGNVRINYKRNTIVANGDADEGLTLDAFYNTEIVAGKTIRHDPYKFYYPDYKSISPDYSLPFDFDPNYTLIYQDKNSNYTVDVGDVRLSEVQIDDTTYYCGSPVTGGNNWFMETPLNMLTNGSNGNFAYMDTEVLPGDIGLNVSVDGKEELMDPAVNNGLHSQHLRVEKTSTITVSTKSPIKKGEKVYVTMHDPEANEFNVFRSQEWVYRPEYNKVDYNVKGKPMNWFGDGGTKAGVWEYELPFSFPFSSKFYNRVFVSEKGFLNFSSNYGLPENFAAADQRIMVYGDDLSILPPSSLMNITTHPTFSGQSIINKDQENIYISNTGDSVTFRWRAQTRYPTDPSLAFILSGIMAGSSGYGTYPALNGLYYALIDVECTLYSDGTIVLNYLKDCPDPTGIWFMDQDAKFQNRVNNVNRNTWIVGAPIIGIAYGAGDPANIIGYRSAYYGLKNLAIVDHYQVNRLRDYWPETWVVDLTPFNRPTTQRGILIGSGQNSGTLYDDYDEWKPFEDVRVLTEENPTATFEYTPYRGTARESGIPDWVEIKAFKETGGGKIAPKDSTYTYLQNINYSDPTVWDSKWTRPEYFRVPWGIFQKTKYFVYPPTEKLVPNELKNTYDCFGIARLQIDPAPLTLIPDKKIINPLDERQPLLTLQIKNADDPEDVNDPQGMLLSSWRRTVEPVANIQIDFGQTDSAWQISPTIVNSPSGAFYLRIYPPHIELYKVGDYVYIPSSYGSPSQPEYRRIVRIIKGQPGNRYNNTIWFDMPLINAHTPGTQVVPNPIIANYNVHGGGIKTMFTTLGGNGQRYIVQVRDNGSYDFWRWYEPLVIGQVIGALDPHDLLYTWQSCVSYDRLTITQAVPYEQVCNPPLQRTPFPIPVGRPPLGLEDMDCSMGQSMNSLGTEDAEFPKLGEWSMNDRYGAFGNWVDNHWNYPNNCPPTAYAYGAINTYGVPVLILPAKTPVTVENLYDDGGKCVIAAWPQDPATPMNIRLYTNTAIFDYNSVYKHPPFFALDTGMGIDYLGEVSINVGKTNPGLNFTDLAIIDHALQNSKIDYTLGSSGLSKMPPPTPQIASRYNPMIKNLRRDIRAYPGGQDHTGRVISNLSVPENPPGNHWNAYPAIWENQFVKLGTEFMPMTDYGIAFYLKTVNPYDHYSFLAGGTQGLIRIEIEGPFAFPKTVMEDNTRGSGVSADQYLYKLSSKYEYNEYKNIPIDYDFSGKLTIDRGNYFKYERAGGNSGLYANPFMGFNMMTGNLDFKRVTNPGFPTDSIIIPDNEINPWLYFGEKWFYWGVGRYNVYGGSALCTNPNLQDWWMFNSVFLLDELIPTGSGQITIKVTTADGSQYTYNNCSEDPPLKSLPVNGIRISNAPKTLEIETDNTLELSLTEGTIPEQDTENCNSAFVIAWQDRGIMNKATGKIMGMGDGQLANPPRSSVWYKTSSQFPEGFDLNEDGKISFDNYETEVLGSYDLATNTWSSGVVDGRTFMREDGLYKLEFSANNKNQIVTMGYDFGGIPDEAGDFDKKPDHVISQYELIPIYINAYKYGDDNQDRAFTPLWKPFSPNEYSHEVYSAGMVKIMPVPHNDLVISYGPDPITAGVTPELVSAEKPLTFRVLDDMGAPVDLSEGVPDKNNQKEILARNIWNLLFQDPHPDNVDFYGQDAKLPQYYWVRTDLHNNDATLYDNNSIYFSTMTPFDPINVDFNRSPEGIYKFFNFCANDAGSFLVRVYTPDRRHYGETTVSVKLPSISYKISNDADTSNTQYEVPGSPDFVMTSMDKRIYTVTVAVQDAQGDPLKGTAGAQICEGTDDARITVTNTFLRNFDGRYVAVNSPRYYNLVGIDKNKNGTIDPLNRERINVDGFGQGGNSGILYYTGNYIDANGYFATGLATDIPPENTYYMGWGLGCIYNSAYKNGYCFPDLDKNGILTFNDSISLDQEGKASFKYYPNDMGLSESFMGAFIGKNRLTTNPSWNDVAGIPSFDSVLAPYNVYRRFKQGGQRYFQSSWSIFRLDWDAHPDLFVSIKGPDFRFLDAQTRQPMGKDLLDPANYDLMYGIENHFIIQAFQADSRDLPLKPDGIVTFSGGRDEKAIYGVLQNGPDGIPEASIRITPAGTGRGLGTITYVLKKGGYGEQSDIDVGLSQYSSFDVTNGIGIKVNALGDLLPKRTISLHIRVQEAAAMNPIAAATIRIEGAGINEKGKTGSDGLCDIDITPSEEGVVIITAEKTGMVKGTTSIYIGKDKRPLFIEMDPFPTLTNQKVFHITGSTKINANVEINGARITSNSQGEFSYDLNLKEGKNEIKTKVVFDEETKEDSKTVILDTMAPEIELSDLGTQVDVKEITLHGRINEQGTVTCNGILATMIGNVWQLNLPVSYGKNSIEIVAKDLAGNLSKIKKELVYVYQKKLVEVQIGNKTVYVDGVAEADLSVAPYIKQGRTMLPIRIIVESLGAKVEYLAKTKEIAITMDSKVISMRIGSKDAFIGQTKSLLEVAPEALQGVTFVPLRFITEAFGFEIEWIQTTRTARITKLF